MEVYESDRADATVNNYMKQSLKVINLAIEALTNLRVLVVSPQFEEATSLLSSGIVWTTGMGKAALAARKLAVTLCCNGVSSSFVHAGEALHGDFGAIKEGDKVVAFSNSGKTIEVVQVAEKAIQRDAKMILITGAEDSPLGQVSGITLCYGDLEEACPLGLTPTTSIITMIAIADALAMGVQAKCGLTYDQYAENHHAGYLGQIAREKSRAS